MTTSERTQTARMRNLAVVVVVLAAIGLIIYQCRGSESIPSGAASISSVPRAASPSRFSKSGIYSTNDGIATNELPRALISPYECITNRIIRAGFSGDTHAIWDMIDECVRSSQERLITLCLYALMIPPGLPKDTLEQLTKIFIGLFGQVADSPSDNGRGQPRIPNCEQSHEMTTNIREIQNYMMLPAVPVTAIDTVIRVAEQFPREFDILLCYSNSNDVLDGITTDIICSVGLPSECRSRSLSWRRSQELGCIEVAKFLLHSDRIDPHLWLAALESLREDEGCDLSAWEAFNSVVESRRADLGKVLANSIENSTCATCTRILDLLRNESLGITDSGTGFDLRR